MLLQCRKSLLWPCKQSSLLLLYQCSNISEHGSEALEQNCKFVKFLLSLNSKRDLYTKKHHQIYKSVPKALERCYNIDLWNLPYWSVSHCQLFFY